MPNVNSIKNNNNNDNNNNNNDNNNKTTTENQSENKNENEKEKVTTSSDTTTVVGSTDIPNSNETFYASLFQQMTEHVANVNDLFYDLTQNEQTLRRHSEVLIEKNTTLSNLCRTLQSDSKKLHENMQQMQAKEKEWREKIQQKFDESLKNIREQISDHETKYNKVSQENEMYRRKIDELIDFEKKKERVILKNIGNTHLN